MIQMVAGRTSIPGLLALAEFLALKGHRRSAEMAVELVYTLCDKHVDLNGLSSVSRKDDNVAEKLRSTCYVGEAPK